jgi:lysophospholipase L1-like esterase
MSCSWGAVNTGCADGRCDTSGYVAPPPSTTRIWIGGAWTWTGAVFQGVISGVCIDPNPNSVCLTTTPAPSGSAIAWLGDSITQGTTTSHPIYPTGELYRLYGQYQSRQVMNWGYLGYGLDNGTTVWNTVKTLPYGSLVVLLGVNDLRAGTTEAVTWPKYLAILNEARARGWRVTPVGVLPWGGWSEWTAPKQVETDKLNADLLNWSLDAGMRYVDTTYMRVTDGGYAMQAAFGYGDGLHLNGAGATALAAGVADAGP